MTIQKKSLISSLNTTKKAIVASTPLAPATSGESSVKMAKAARLGKATSMAKLGKATSMAKFAKFAKLGKI